MRLNLTRIDRDGHIALFNLGHLRFQLYFKSNWHPLFFSSENADLNQLLVMANMLLSSHAYLKPKSSGDKSKDVVSKAQEEENKTSETEETKVDESSSKMDISDSNLSETDTQKHVEAEKEGENSKKVEEKTLEEEKEKNKEDSAMQVDEELKSKDAAQAPTKPEEVVEIGLGSVFDIIMQGYKSQYQFDENDMEEDFMDDEDTAEDEEDAENGENKENVDPREPTETEWSEIVMPAIRRFMRREDMAPYLMDEWTRRVNQTKASSGMMSALNVIRDELISGGIIPKPLRPFVPRQAFGYHSNTIAAGLNGGFGAGDSRTKETSKRVQVNTFLTNQWQKMSQRLKATTGFYARPLKGDMLHWTINFFDFDSNSPLGVSLMQLALQHHSFNDKSDRQIVDTDLASSELGVDAPAAPRYFNPTKKVEAANIVLEILFPDTFDDEEALPVFRLIRPTLDLPPDFFENVFKTFVPKATPSSANPSETASSASPGATTSSNQNSQDSTSPEPRITPSYYASLMTSSGGASVTSDSLAADSVATDSDSSKLLTASTATGTTMSSAVDSQSESSQPTASNSLPTPSTGNVWRDQKFDLFDFLVDLRLCLANQSPKVDMNSAMTGYQTTGFWKRFRCISAAIADEQQIEGTGKVCLPISCLELIYGSGGSGRAAFSLSQSGSVSPMTFELYGIESKVQTYCGVLEFTAQEGTVVIPSWMISMLNFQEGEQVMLRKISLPPGDFVKLQPLDDSHVVEGINPKALLEWRLRNFVALTKGEILPIISDSGHTFKFSVLEVKPGHSIAITDRDITVEFVDPLETSETPQAAPKIDKSKTTASSSPSSSAKPPLRTGHTTTEDEQAENCKKCETCRHMIPEAAYLTHSMRCPRMNYYCEACQCAVAKAEKEAHDAEKHMKIQCARCNAQLERRDLPNHAENLCPARIVKCPFCELNMPESSRLEHENQCGSRTVKCTDCGVRVSMRFLEQHTESGCVKKEEPRRYDSPSRDNGRPNEFGATPANSQIFLCETCKAPIDSFDELQVHMLTVHYNPDNSNSSSAMDVTETEPSEDATAKVPEE